MTRKLDIIGAIVFTFILTLGAYPQFAQTFSGTTNTLGDGFAETDNIKFYDEFWWDTENRTDTIAYPEQAASYIISKSGSNYHAKSGSTGQIDYSGTDGHNVFQSALNTSGAYRIEFKGTISIDANTLLLRDYQAIIGEDSVSAKIQYTGTGTAIQTVNSLEDPTNDVLNVKLQSFTIQSTTGNGKYGLYMLGAKLWEVSNLRIIDFNATNGWGIYLSGNDGDGLVGAYYNSFYNNLVSGCRNGVALNGTTGNGLSNDNMFIKQRIFSCGLTGSTTYGVYDIGTANSFYNPTIESLKTGATYYYADGGRGILSCGRIEHSGSAASTTGINLNSSSQYYTILNPMVTGFGGGTYGVDSGTKNSVMASQLAIHNILTKDVDIDFGSQTIASLEYISHDLGSTPTSVLITSETPVYGGEPFVIGITYKNSTHIRPRIYWVNGTEVTDDTILVYWSTHK